MSVHVGFMLTLSVLGSSARMLMGIPPQLLFRLAALSTLKVSRQCPAPGYAANNC